VRIGPVDTSVGLYFRADNRLAMVTLDFPSQAYEAMREIFIDRYGPPTERLEEPVQTRGGGQFTNELLRWEGTTAAVSIRRFEGSTIRTGRAVIQTAADRAAEVARMRELMKRGKGDL